MFVHDSNTTVVREHEIDFAERHFRRESPPAAGAGPREFLVSANAYRKYVLALSAVAGERAQALAWLGLDAARQTLEQMADSAGAWKNIGEIELHRASPGRPTSRCRVALDPVLDLSLVRATYALAPRRGASAR